MTDSILDALLAPSTALPEHPAARAGDGLVRSYLHRGTYALLAARALSRRLGARIPDEVLARDLRHASEYLCKAVRVALGLSATRSQSVRALVSGAEGIVPTPRCPLSSRLEAVATFSEHPSLTGALASAWLDELDALASEITRLPVAPRATSRRATPRSVRRVGP